jgi:hypothetical protein
MTGLLDEKRFVEVMTARNPAAEVSNDATWEDLSEVRIKSKAYRGKTVKYREIIPLDKLAEIQARFPGAAARTQMLDMYVEILSAVLVAPAVENEQHKRALRKADGGFLTTIAQEVLGASVPSDASVETAKN